MTTILSRIQVRHFWAISAIVISLGVIAPIAVLIASWTEYQSEIWQHLYQHSMLRLLANTAILLTGVGTLSLILGTGLAYVVTQFEFPCRRILSKMLILPLGIPSYVFAFVYIGLFDFSGPLAVLLRDSLAIQGTLPIRSTWGVIVVMSLALYPYVYMLAKNAFESQASILSETVASLGCNRWRYVFNVSLPMAWPWVGAGLILVLLETLADFGAVSVFNYDTFTTAIYKAWYGFHSFTTASQLATVLLFFSFLLLIGESHFRRHRKEATILKGPPPQRIRPSIGGKLICFALCWLILIFAFLLPTGQLLYWAITESSHTLPWQESLNSVSLSLLVGGFILCFSLVLCYGLRFSRWSLQRAFVRLATLGYSMPGPVIAVAFFAVFMFLSGGDSKYLSISIVPLVLALAFRYLLVGFQPVKNQLEAVSKNLDEVSLSLGKSWSNILVKVHTPLIIRGIFVAFLLAVIDSLKEMPISLMMRPFGWDTLAVNIYNLTSEGEWQLASIPSLMIIGISLLPILFLNRFKSKSSL